MNSAHSARPIVIGHRGCSGERPEHTLEAYERAIQQGADYIEPDLVLTRDGVLVCRHENDISGTTDVAARAEFANRRITKQIDGAAVTGWFAEDFTLAEMQTLRAKERLPLLRPANAAFDGQFSVPTFAEVLDLARARDVGIYPELKHPSFLQAQGLDPVGALIGAFRRAGGQAAVDRAFVQCFEVGPLVTLASMSSLRWTNVQLMSAEGGPADRPGVTYAQMSTPAGLAAITDYARAIGVEKAMIIPRDAAARSLAPTALIGHAHAAGLAVHAWTFRAENTFLPLECRSGEAGVADYERRHGDLARELRAFYAVGVDGVFSDFPAIAAAAR